jgi:hypothetical protein
MLIVYLVAEPYFKCILLKNCRRLTLIIDHSQGLNLSNRLTSRRSTLNDNILMLHVMIWVSCVTLVAYLKILTREVIYA